MSITETPPPPPPPPIEERVEALEGLCRELKNRIDAVTPAADKEKTAYQHAADWLRMVNTITWTLTSIFLVGSIIALNGAMQSNNAGWRELVGWGVFFLCIVWAAIDFTYAISSLRARKILKMIETRWQSGELGLYQDQSSWWSLLLRFILNVVLIYGPILGVGLIALSVAGFP